MPTRSSSRLASMRAACPTIFLCNASASVICFPILCTGLRLLAGSWKIIAIRPPRTFSSTAGGAPINSWPSSTTLPLIRALLGNSPRAASQVTDLPQPLSPTSPTASPLAIERSMPRRAGAPSKATESPVRLTSGFTRQHANCQGQTSSPSQRRRAIRYCAAWR